MRAIGDNEGASIGTQLWSAAKVKTTCHERCPGKHRRQQSQPVGFVPRRDGFLNREGARCHTY
jgi:hypothetical protein